MHSIVHETRRRNERCCEFSSLDAAQTFRSTAQVRQCSPPRRSPAFIGPTPAGVPVRIKSPGSSVIAAVIYRSSSAIGKIKSLVDPLCFTSPFTRVVTVTAPPPSGSTSPPPPAPPGKTYRTPSPASTAHPSSADPAPSHRSRNYTREYTAAHPHPARFSSHRRRSPSPARPQSPRAPMQAASESSHPAPAATKAASKTASAPSEHRSPAPPHGPIVPPDAQNLRRRHRRQQPQPRQRPRSKRLSLRRHTRGQILFRSLHRLNCPKLTGSLLHQRIPWHRVRLMGSQILAISHRSTHFLKFSSASAEGLLSFPEVSTAVTVYAYRTPGTAVMSRYAVASTGAAVNRTASHPPRSNPAIHNIPRQVLIRNRLPRQINRGRLARIRPHPASKFGTAASPDGTAGGNTSRTAIVTPADTPLSSRSSCPATFTERTRFAVYT